MTTPSNHMVYDNEIDNDGFAPSVELETTQENEYLNSPSSQLQHNIMSIQSIERELKLHFRQTVPI